MDFTQPEFWIAVGQIILIDILLGGDNAVVIALASRRLPEAQRKQAIFWGMFGAIALRVVLIFFALQLLRIPWLKIDRRAVAPPSRNALAAGRQVPPSPVRSAGC